MLDIETQLLEYRLSVERFLDEATVKTAGDTSVVDAMRYSLLSGGKRVRATLTLAAYALFSSDTSRALPAAAAIEMLHCYSLIHDDLPAMDDSDLRRGNPSSHIAFSEATAILTGDALLTLAFETLASIEPADAAIRCVKILAEGAGFRGMVKGQQLDELAENNGVSNLSDLNDVYLHKTGKLITAAVQMGGVIARADRTGLDALSVFAGKIGLVFQIIDDILDEQSDAATLGKPVLGDQKRKKSTYVSLVGLERSKEIAGACTEEAKEALRPFGTKANLLIHFADRLAERTV